MLPEPRIRHYIYLRAVSWRTHRCDGRPLSESGPIRVSRLGRAGARSFPARARTGRLERAPDRHALLAREPVGRSGYQNPLEYRIRPGQVHYSRTHPQLLPGAPGVSTHTGLFFRHTRAVVGHIRGTNLVTTGASWLVCIYGSFVAAFDTRYPQESPSPKTHHNPLSAREKS